jgi:hypothetical protein
MAIRNPRFTGQFNAPDARFNVPTSGVSGRVPTNTSSMKTKNILNLLGGVQKIAGDISERYSASEFQNLTSEFEREKIDLFDRTTSDVNNYNDFSENGMKGHDALVKKYEKLAKEKNINPNYSAKLKTFTLNSGDAFKNSLVSNARRVEPAVLGRKAQNMLAGSLTNLRGGHPDSNPNTRAIKDELFLTLDRFASVLGEETVKNLKRNYLFNSEKAFFETVVRDNPGFFIEGHKDYTGFKFAYTDTNDIAKNVDQAKSINRQIENEIERNRVKDLSNVRLTEDAVVSNAASIRVQMQDLSRDPTKIPSVVKSLGDRREVINKARLTLASNLDVSDRERRSLNKKYDMADAGVTNDIEFLSTLELAIEQQSPEDIDGIIDIYTERGKQLGGDLIIDFEKNFTQRQDILENVKISIKENIKIKDNIKKIKVGDYDRKNPDHKKAMAALVAAQPKDEPFLYKLSVMNPEITQSQINNSSTLDLAILSFFPGAGESQGMFGPGAEKLVSIANETQEIHPKALQYLSNIITSSTSGNENDLKRGAALNFIIKGVNANVISSQDLKEYKLDVLYNQYVGLGGALNPSQIGAALRQEYSIKVDQRGPFATAPNMNEQISKIYEPGLNGQSIYGRDVFNVMIEPRTTGFDSFTYSVGRLLKMRNSIDGEDGPDTVEDILPRAQAEAFNDPKFQETMKKLHTAKVRLYLAEGKTIEAASKIAVREIAQMDFTDVFRIGRITKTSQVFRPNWVVGDKQKIRIDAMYFTKPGQGKFGKPIIFMNEKLYVPLTGEEAMAYTGNLKFNKGSDREFPMVNPKHVRFEYVGKDGMDQHAWKIYIKNQLILGQNNMPLLYKPLNDPENLRARREEKYTRKRGRIPRLLNNISREITGQLQ